MKTLFRFVLWFTLALPVFAQVTIPPPAEATDAQITAGTARNVYVSPRGATAAGGFGGGGGGAPTAATYITQTPHAGLSAEQALSLLGTGILKNTTTTGVVSIAVAGDFPTLNQNTTGSAVTLANARTFSITGDLAYTSGSFDGSANVTGTGTLATVNANVGTFGSATASPQITINAKGLTTAGANVTITPAIGSVTGLGADVGTFLATPSSANLLAALTDETGSGVAVFGTSPAFTTSATTGSTTFALLNTTATTINAFGAASVALNMGHASGSTSMLGIIGFDGATPSSSTAAIFPAATTALSSLRLPHGTAPTSPVNGDLWTTTAGLAVRINGATVALGAGASTITVADEASDATSFLTFVTAATGDLGVKTNANLGFNASNGVLTLPGSTISAPATITIAEASPDTGTLDITKKFSTAAIDEATRIDPSAAGTSGQVCSIQYTNSAGAVAVATMNNSGTDYTTNVPAGKSIWVTYISNGTDWIPTVGDPAAGTVASTSLLYGSVAATRVDETYTVAAAVSTTLTATPATVAQGGTGLATLTASNLLVGNGTGNVTFIAPGTGVATALAVNVGSAGAFVTFNGAGGTPSSLTLTNGTALPIAGLTASTSTAIGVGSVELGHATDTTIARGAAGRITIETINVPTISSTDDFTNKTINAAATGNVLKLKGYIYLTHPHLADGTNATIGTTATAIGYGHATFSNSVDQASNYVEYYIQVPEDLDTSVALRARLKVLLGGADTNSQRYVVSSVSVADSAVPTASTLANAINIDFAGDASGASGDVETSAWTTLTSWAGALTAGQTWRIRLARDGDTSDTSTVNSTELGLVLEYGITQ